MALTHTYRVSVSGGGTGTVSSSYPVTGDAMDSVSDIALASDTLDLVLSVDKTKVVSWYLESDQDVRVNVNSPTDQYFDLVAKKAVWWNNARTESNPLTFSITSLHFVNAGLVDANVVASFLLDLS